MKKVSVIGHFGFGHEYIDGQTVKTKILTDELCHYYGEESVLKIDTHGGLKTLVKAPFQVFSALKKSQNVIMLPAHNGVRVFGRLLPMFKRFFKGRKIHYSVIGGWLPKLVETKKGLAKALKKLDGIYVETSTMKNDLEQQGFKNVHVVPNFKNLTPLSSNELVYSQSEPYKLCTFSRVTKQKGIEDAVDAVKAVNEALGRVVCQLDIYGPIDNGQNEWFDELKKRFPDYVKYGGSVPFDKSVEVLKNYFALLFPTRFYTEGIPGTIIDAYAAGVPVISARWQSFSDIVEEGQTGIGYSLGEKDELVDILSRLVDEPERILNMKNNCLKKSADFLPSKVIEDFVKHLI